MKYEYDAAGRLVKEGDKVYSYIGLDKIESVTEGGQKLSSFTYHIDGQLAEAVTPEKRESFQWDGLALIQRNSTNYVNEPAVTGGNPILADDKVLFNDMLGTTLGIKDGDKVMQNNLTAFGESLSASPMEDSFFTGKPHVGEMGYVFLFRAYRADQGKWQTADPAGYPDGWNNFSYCNNKAISSFDLKGLCRQQLCWDEYGNLYYETLHDIEESINEVRSIRGDLITTLAVTCGTGTRSVTIVAGNASFSLNPEAFGFAVGTITWNSSYSEKTVTLDFTCNLPENTTHSEYGQKIVDYYVYSSIHIIGEKYKCGESKLISQRPVGTAYIDGVIRKITTCSE